jgi:hypothetical protein
MTCAPLMKPHAVLNVAIGSVRPTFISFYQQGNLDDGENLEDFTLWAGFYQIKLDREKALQALSSERLKQLESKAKGKPLAIKPHEPTLSAAN